MALSSTYQSTDLPLLSTIYEPPPKHLISVLGGVWGRGGKKPGWLLTPVLMCSADRRPPAAVHPTPPFLPSRSL